MENPEILLSDLVATDAWIRTLAGHLVRNDDDAQDVAQDAWVRYLTHRPDRRGPIQRWMTAVLRNLATSRRRADSHRTEREQAVAKQEEVPSVAELWGQEQLRRRIANAVFALDEPYRTSILLRYFRGHAPNEVAAQLGVSAAAVETRLRRGLQKLRARLDREFGDRRSWCAALLPLAGHGTAEAATTAGAASASVLAGALAMSTKIKIGIGILLAAVSATALWPRESDPGFPMDSGNATPALNPGQVPTAAGSAAGAPEVGSKTAPALNSHAAGPVQIIRVVDSANASPIAHASVEVSFDERPSQRDTTDDDGCIRVERQALDQEWYAVVQAKGYVPIVSVHAVCEDVVSIELVRESEIRLVFRHDDGTPVQGVKVRLLPEPVDGPGWEGSPMSLSDPQSLVRSILIYGRVQRHGKNALWKDIRHEMSASPQEFTLRLLRPCKASWIAMNETMKLPCGMELHPSYGLVLGRVDRESDEQGFVCWDGLPSGAGYRWRLCSAHFLDELTPPFEAETRDRDGHFFGPGNELSGRIALEAGQKAFYEVRVRRSARISGRVAPIFGGIQGQVTLIHHRKVKIADPGVSEYYNRFETEHSLLTDRDGNFAVDRCRPGEKVLRAVWSNGKDAFFFGKRAFALADGETRDLGIVQAEGGNVIEGIVEIVDSGGRVLDPTNTFGKLVQSELTIISGGSAGAPGTVRDVIVVGVGQTFSLQGIEDGKLWIKATPHGRWQKSTDAGQSGSAILRDMGYVRRRVPFSERLRLRIMVNEPVDRDLEFRLPNEVMAGEIVVRMKEQPEGRSEELRVRVSQKRTGTRVRTGSGKVAILAVMKEVAGMDGSLCGLAEVDFSKVDRAEITLGWAGEIQGTYLGTDGRVLPGKILQWTFGPWEGGSRPTWLYKARTDEQGRFRVRGLPPGVKLRGYRENTSIEPLGCGEIRTVVFRSSG